MSLSPSLPCSPRTKGPRSLDGWEEDKLPSRAPNSQELREESSHRFLSGSLQMCCPSGKHVTPYYGKTSSEKIFPRCVLCRVISESEGLGNCSPIIMTSESRLELWQPAKCISFSCIFTLYVFSITHSHISSTECS